MLDVKVVPVMHNMSHVPHHVTNTDLLTCTLQRPRREGGFCNFKCKITRLILPPLSHFSFHIISLPWIACFLSLIPLFHIPSKISILLFLYTFEPLLVYLWSPYLVPCFRVRMCDLLSDCSYVLCQNVPDIKLCWNPSLFSFSLYAAISIHHSCYFSRFSSHVIVVMHLWCKYLFMQDFRKYDVKCPAT